MPPYDDITQAAHKISHRQHLIEEAKKAYAAKLVADKAGGASAGMSWLPESPFPQRLLPLPQTRVLARQTADLAVSSLASHDVARRPGTCKERECSKWEADSIVITNIEDPKFDLEKLINYYTTSS